MNEEKYIKEVLQDYESPLELNAMWSSLDLALDKGVTAPSVPEKEVFSIKKYLPLLLFLLVSGCGFYAYQNFGKALFSSHQHSSNLPPVQMADDNDSEVSEYLVDSEYKSPISYPSQANEELASESVNKVIQEKVITTNTAITPSITQQNSFKKSNDTQLNNTQLNDNSLTPLAVNQKAANTTTVFKSQSHFLAVDDKKDIPSPQLSVLESTNTKDDQNVSVPYLNVLASGPFYIGYERTLNPDFHFQKTARARRIIPKKKNGFRLSIQSGFAASSNGSNPSPIAHAYSLSTTEFKRLIRPTFGLQLEKVFASGFKLSACLLYTSPSPRDATLSRMPSSA